MAKPAARRLSAEQARDAQGEARARVRLRRRGLPLAQARRGRAGRVAAARALRRRGALQHVGVAASFTTEKRRELVSFLAPYRKDALARPPVEALGRRSRRRAAQRMPGAKSRWSQGKDLSWEPLRPELVVEVAYDHMQGTRFRHTAQFRRWRPDKEPRECTYAQLEVVAPHELAAIFAERSARMSFKDLFSERPDQYARYRPTYPAAVFEWLAAQTPNTKLAVDVGTGQRPGRRRARRSLRSRNRPRSERGPARERAGASARRIPPVAAPNSSRPRTPPATRCSSRRRCTGSARSVLPRGPPRARARRCTGRGVLRAVRDHPRDRRRGDGALRGDLDAYWEPERGWSRRDTARSRFRSPSGRPAFDMRAMWTLEDLVGYLGHVVAAQAFPA